MTIYVTHRNHTGTAMCIVRLMQLLGREKHLWRKVALVLLERRLRARFGCFVARKAVIGDRCQFPHPVGIVIGEGAIIGDGCVIYQNVTIGAQRSGDGKRGLYPRIGDNVTIFAGAAILGPVTIGSNATVGANAVVLRDVPDAAVAVGVPATIRTQAMS